MQRSVDDGIEAENMEGRIYFTNRVSYSKELNRVKKSRQNYTLAIPTSP